MEDRATSMGLSEIKVDIGGSATDRRRGAAFLRAIGGGPEAFVYQRSTELVEGLFLRLANGAIHTSPVTLKTEEELAHFLEEHKKCLVIALLPNSQYMQRMLEIPAALGKEAEDALALEVEALLPAGVGDAEVSYLELPPKREGHTRYEAYVARRSVIDQLLSPLGENASRVTAIWPTAVILRMILKAGTGADLVVVESSGALEAAFMGDDSDILVRTIESRDADGNGLPRALAESLRSLLTRAAPDDGPLVIGWLGGECPHYLENGQFTIERATVSVRPLENETTSKDAVCPLLYVAGAIAVGPVGTRLLESTNLAPQQLKQRRQQRRTHKLAVAGILSALLAVMLVFVALKVLTARYEAAEKEISTKLSMIEKEGRAVGRRIRQLDAIEEARVTQGDFFDVLAGLYEATPEGVTYSHVELSDAGELGCRGQAVSLAQPFLLPERLQLQPMFTRAALYDAGQVKKGRGSITEFRMTCSLARAQND